MLSELWWSDAQGFHRIEALLFRDGNLEAALLYAEDLINDSDALLDVLSGDEEFDAVSSFVGMIGLATEVGAKKMSSEEETYSDLSVLIFHNNYLGVLSQYTPFKAAVEEADAELAGEIDEAFADWLDAIAPFATENEDGTFTYQPYTEVSVADRKAIQAGAYKVAMKLAEARDVLGISPPDDESEDEPCTGDAEVFPGDSEVVAAGLDYFRALMPYQIAQVQSLLDAIEGGDVEDAIAAYKNSRPLYEQIEVLAGSFSDEDSDIDARPYAFERGEFDEAFKGFHKIERYLYRDGNVGKDTVQAANGLLDSMNALDEKLNTPDLFGGLVNFEGIYGLATEVPAKKISSEEETFSGLSHLIFYNNWKGIYSQVKAFAAEVGEEMVEKMDKVFGDAFACLPVTTDDVWSAVEEDKVSQEFVDSLSQADYPQYDLADMETRECIIINAYKIREIVLEVAEELGLFPDCHPFHKDSVFKYRHSTA